jgi:hypothetical protein
MSRSYWLDWIQAASIRSLKTIAQTLLAAIGTTTVMGDLNWGTIASTALLAGILSLLTSIVGLPEVDVDTDDIDDIE